MTIHLFIGLAMLVVGLSIPIFVLLEFVCRD